MAELQRGVVKWFNDAKGFGFIEHSSGKDVFVHYSVIEWDGFKTLKDGEEVEYVLSQGDKGLHAARVTRVGAIRRKLENEKAEQSLEATAEYVAPHLETGKVATSIKPASSMIEVDVIKDEKSSLERLGEEGVRLDPLENIESKL